jgi:hypothetical protein
LVRLADIKVVEVENDESSSVSVAPHVGCMSGEDCLLEVAPVK